LPGQRKRKETNKDQMKQKREIAWGVMIAKHHTPRDGSEPAAGRHEHSGSARLLFFGPVRPPRRSQPMARAFARRLLASLRDEPASAPPRIVPYGRPTGHGLFFLFFLLFFLFASLLCSSPIA